MAIRIYKDAGGLFRKENNIIPAGNYRLVYNTDQSQAGIYGKDNYIELVKLQLISQIQDEAGTPYNNAAELEAALQGFFNLAGADRIPDSFIFASAIDRDAYFSVNKNQLYPGLDIIESGIIETWVNGANPPVYDNANWASYSEPLTASEIKVLYESNSDTNALIDAKLAILNFLTLTAQNEIESAVDWIFPPGTVQIGDSDISSGGRIISTRSISTGNQGAFQIQLFDDNSYKAATITDPLQTLIDIPIQNTNDTIVSGIRINNFRQIVQADVQFMRIIFKPEGGVISVPFSFAVKINSEDHPAAYREVVDLGDPALTDLGSGMWELKLNNPTVFDAGFDAYIKTEGISLLGGNGYVGPILFGDPDNNDFFPYITAESIPIVRKNIATEEYADQAASDAVDNIDLNTHNVTELADVTDAGSGAIITDAERTSLSSFALKTNVLELDNTDPFTPDADYKPATKKYVDDHVSCTNTMSITPTVNIENLDVSSLSPVGTLFVNNSTNRELKSLAGGINGDIVNLVHTTEGDLKLKRDDGFTGQMMRMPNDADDTLTKYGGCTLIFNSTTGFWHVIGLYY